MMEKYKRMFMRKWGLRLRKIIDASLILTTFIFAIAGNAAGQGTRQKAMQNVSFNYPELRSQINSGSDIGSATTTDDKQSVKVHSERGIAYSEKGQYDLAIAEFNKALRIDPLEVGIYNDRGITFAKKGQYKLAIADFTKAIGVNRNDAVSYYNRGVTYAAVRQFDLALQDFNRYLELNPVNAAVYEARGGIHAALACSDWGQACEAGDCDQLKEAIRIGFCTRNKQKE
jgi:Flp pilus assembly protein TadD